eukprot:scaffold1211_cov169-Amphora_coffeaeformis.AAC.1
MLYRYFLPTGGGGWLRRSAHFNKQIFKRMWETPDKYPLSPITLFDFTREDDAADVLTNRKNTASGTTTHSRDTWRLSDDRVIGGYSESLAHLIRPSITTATEEEETEARIEKEHTEGADDDDDESEESIEKQLWNTKRPFLRWYGNLDTTVGLESKAQRSGFAALRSPTFHMGGANLRGAYTALEVTCRTDGRVYTINLQVSTSLPNDTFQGMIDVPPTPSGRWDRLYLPFTEFGFLGSSGHGGRGFAPRKVASRIINEEETYEMDEATKSDHRQQHFRRRNAAHRKGLEIGAPEQESVQLDNKIIIESIGFTLMDRHDGPFQFDLAQIRAVNFFEDEVFEKVPDNKGDFFTRPPI